MYREERSDPNMLRKDLKSHIRRVEQKFGVSKVLAVSQQFK